MNRTLSSALLLVSIASAIAVDPDLQAKAAAGDAAAKAKVQEQEKLQSCQNDSSGLAFVGFRHYRGDLGEGFPADMFELALKNITPKPISAFKGSLNRLDDFGEVKGSFPFSHTSESNYEPDFGASAPAHRNHVVKAGETIYLCFIQQRSQTLEFGSPRSLFTPKTLKNLGVAGPDGVVVRGKFKLSIDKAIYPEGEAFETQ